VNDYEEAAAMPGSPASPAASQDGQEARALEGEARAREGQAGPAAHPGGGMGAALLPLLIDAGVPLGVYYLLHAAFGLSVWLSLALSSAVPAARTAVGMATGRKLNMLAALMLVVNLAGITVSFLTGDPRAMIAKDSLVSSVIAVAILASVATRRPLMSAGLKLFMTGGTPERIAAWDRLSAGCARFRRLEMLFSANWGCALLADCAARIAGAYTLPVTTMAWLSTVMILGAVGAATVAGSLAAMPIQKMINTAAAASLPPETGIERSGRHTQASVTTLAFVAMPTGARLWLLTEQLVVAPLDLVSALGAEPSLQVVAPSLRGFPHEGLDALRGHAVHAFKVWPVVCLDEHPAEGLEGDVRARRTGETGHLPGYRAGRGQPRRTPRQGPGRAAGRRSKGRPG
jgi:hypothetical protein